MHQSASVQGKVQARRRRRTETESKNAGAVMPTGSVGRTTGLCHILGIWNGNKRTQHKGRYTFHPPNARQVQTRVGTPRNVKAPDTGYRGGTRSHIQADITGSSSHVRFRLAGYLRMAGRYSRRPRILLWVKDSDPGELQTRRG